MKEILICLISFSTLISIHGQEKDEIVFEGLGVTSIIYCKIGEEVLKAKCPCSVFDEKKCILYKMQALDIVAYFENNVFTEDELSTFSYILAPKSLSIESNKRYVLSVQPSSSSEYIQGGSVLDIDVEKEYEFRHKDGYLTSKIECDQKDKFEDFLLSLDN